MDLFNANMAPASACITMWKATRPVALTALALALMAPGHASPIPRLDEARWAVSDGAVASKGYSHDEALAHLYLAMAAYCDVADWDCPPCAKASAAFGPRGAFVVTRTFYGNASSMQGYVASAPGLVVVAFRGSAAYLNYWLDLEEYRTAPYPDCSGCLVHSGFLAAFTDVSKDVLEGVREALERQPDAELVVVGHSLGGAVAVIAALQLDIAARAAASAASDGRREQAPRVRGAADERRAPAAKAPSAVFTFGEPRVGNAAFALFYAKASAAWPTWRVTHERDIVPHLPPRSMLIPYLLDYAHHTREVWYHAANNSLDPDRQFAICSAAVGEDFACADSVWVYELSIADHVHYLGEFVGYAACAAPAAAQPPLARAPPGPSAEEAAELGSRLARTPAWWLYVRAQWRLLRARLADTLVAFAATARAKLVG